MTRALSLLTTGLEMRLRQQISQRTDAMVRHLAHLHDQRYNNLSFVLGHGWSVERLEILCVLNSFFQVVLGPLAGAAFTYAHSPMVAAVPVHYGQYVFDRRWALEVRASFFAFRDLVLKCGASERVLLANRADDLVNALANELRRRGDD
jgi:hypothetical protein